MRRMFLALAVALAVALPLRADVTIVQTTSGKGGPIGLEEAWAVELGHFGFRDGTATRQLNDAIAFFSRAFELAVQHKQHAVLRYAVVTAQRWHFTDDGWRTVQGLLFRAASADPGTLPVAIVLLANHIAIGRQLNVSSLSTGLSVAAPPRS